MSDRTWTGWTFKMGNKAFKGIRPINMTIEQELNKEVISSTFYFFKKYMMMPTGRWSVVLIFDRGPSSVTRSERVYFSSREKAKIAFDGVYNQVFLNKEHKVPPMPPKKKRPSTVKKKAIHLSIVED